MLPPLKPIPIKDRVSVIFVEKGQVDVLDLHSAHLRGHFK